MINKTYEKKIFYAWREMNRTRAWHDLQETPETLPLIKEIAELIALKSWMRSEYRRGKYAEAYYNPVQYGQIAALLMEAGEYKSLRTSDDTGFVYEGNYQWWKDFQAVPLKDKKEPSQYALIPLFQENIPYGLGDFLHLFETKWILADDARKLKKRFIEK